MKCPACDQENSTLLCSQCGFDASRDYEQYPTFGPVGRMPSVSAVQRNWHVQDQEKLDQISALLTVLLAVRYGKLALEDPFVRAEQLRTQNMARMLRQEQQRVLDLSQRLEQELRSNAANLTAFLNTDEQLRQAQGDNRHLSQQIQRLEQKLTEIKAEKQASGKKLKKANNRIQNVEAKNNTLQAENIVLRQENTDLKAALEAERSKGVLSRLFNR